MVMLSKMEDERLKFVLVDPVYDPLNWGSIFPARGWKKGEGTLSDS
jgi:hypothetical protein